MALPVTASRTNLALIPVLFTATIFLSAALLFFVQPLFTKIVLPQIGGAPAVWTTAMLFFQTALIGGYLYAHVLTRYLPVRAQVAVHLSLWALALTFLPLAIPEMWRYDPATSPVLQTLALFAASVGLPFAVLSANAPLIQSWYARSGGPAADDPYFLYGASNLGSLLALLSFPLVAEPLFGVQRIGLGWAAGFGVLGLLLLSSGLSARTGAGPVAVVQAARAAPVTLRQIGVWLVLAFVPSSLMLAVTSKIATDVGSIPLVWVVPLALYLLTFVVCFTKRPLLDARWRLAVFIVSMAFLGLVFAGLTDKHMSLPMAGLLVAAFFGVALYAHGRLYDSRPAGQHLTLFYLTMSVGGALGGLFNSIIAPAAFDLLYEGAVTVAIAALLPLLATGPTGLVRPALARLVGGMAVLATLYGVVVVAQLGKGENLFVGRSFFGTHRVYEVPAAGLRLYGNGTTIHGAQRLADLGAVRPEPQSYYHRNGPLAQVLASERGMRARNVGIVGLGTGALACYRQPGQTWRFYEIDPMVDQVARDPALFTFMSACAGDSPTHLGDARLVLAAQPEVSFDILVIDAYSSDSVPIHLTTTEAMQVYLDRLAPDGILVYHISNRYYGIDRPLGRSAAHLGLAGLFQPYGGNIDADPGDLPSHVAIFARDMSAFAELGQDERWMPLASDGGRLWTDDYANLLSILK